MKVVELKELKRHNNTLHYFREFKAVAVLEGAGKQIERAVAFSIEKKPFGKPEIIISFEEEPEWPLLPIISSLKSLLMELDGDGRLP